MEQRTGIQRGEEWPRREARTGNCSEHDGTREECEAAIVQVPHDQSADDKKGPSIERRGFGDGGAGDGDAGATIDERVETQIAVATRVKGRTA